MAEHGQFVASLSSPLDMEVRDARNCTSCHTKDCIKGQAQSFASVQDATQRGEGSDLHGYELWLYQERKDRCAGRTTNGRERLVFCGEAIDEGHQGGKSNGHFQVKIYP